MVHCKRCDRLFSSQSAYSQHVRDSSWHNTWEDCDRDCLEGSDLIQHYKCSPCHHYCIDCNLHFDDQDELIDHYRTENGHAYCGWCSKVLRGQRGLDAHNKSRHYPCKLCERVFRTENELKQHLNSSTHKPKDVPCLFCDMAFVSKSALILHLESGACQSGVNRQKVNQYLRDMDRDNLITDPSRLLTAGDNTNVDYIATERSWNGEAYECVLCHSRFVALVNLNRHLASPHHESKIYKCPLSSCGVHFRTLSGLCQHVESEKCGILKFVDSQNAGGSPAREIIQRAERPGGYCVSICFTFCKYICGLSILIRDHTASDDGDQSSEMRYCDRCERSFPSHHAYHQHIRDSASHHVCDDCDIDFPTWRGLKEHWVQDPDHDYCQYCDEHFSSRSDLIEHYRDCHHYCESCNKMLRNFPTWLGLKEHWVQDSDHDYCQYCDEHFSSRSALIDHYNDDHYYCESCNRVFKSDHGLHEHNRQRHGDRYCVSCKRLFRFESNLNSASFLCSCEAHLNSSVHRPKDVPCPFRGCDMAFVSKSALILHLESGSCQSGVNRQRVNQYVRDMDRNNAIIDPSRLLTAGDNTSVDYIATERSWNGNAFECVLCHSRFAALRDLNRHLASPRHQSKIYKCPLSSCGVHFRTLSALCQHVESEKCGIMKFQVVKRTLDSMLTGIGRIGYY
ncbi:hypothetical protein EDC04DRAFT_2578163 [Pisolithus marmoratus]|nr:hypothetical protein EDC04DRAFT_2578163 [Pisolithus marmoratus]